MGDHFGNVLWVRTYDQSIPKDYEYYRNHGNKFEANTYLKADWEIMEGFKIFGDMQYRYVNYHQLNGINDEDLDSIPVHQTFHFGIRKRAFRTLKMGTTPMSILQLRTASQIEKTTQKYILTSAAGRTIVRLRSRLQLFTPSF